MKTDFNKIITEAQEQLDSSNFREAAFTLRKVTDYPNNFIEVNSQLYEVLKIVLVTAKEFSMDSLVSAVQEIIDKGPNAQLMFNLAYALIDVDWPGFAASILKILFNNGQTVAIIVQEYVVALEMMNLNSDAVKVLKKAEALLKDDFMLNYYLAFNAAACGDITESRKGYSQMNLLQSNEESSQEMLLERIRLFLMRFDCLQKKRKVDEFDLRSWHYIINDSIVLYYSPYGWETMTGRWGGVSDNATLMSIGINKMAVVAKKLDLDINQILYVDDFRSEILGKALAKHMNLPVKKFGEKNPEEKGLIAVFNWETVPVETMKVLYYRHKDQYIWCQNAKWYKPKGPNPDFVTILAQMIYDPWETSPFNFTADHKIDPKPLMEKDIEISVNQILNQDISKEEFLKQDDLIRFVEQLKTTMAEDIFVPEMKDGYRPRAFQVNAVKSSWFI